MRYVSILLVFVVIIAAVGCLPGVCLAEADAVRYDPAAVTRAVCCVLLQRHWPMLTTWSRACPEGEASESSSRQKFVAAALHNSRHWRRREEEAGPSHHAQLAALCDSGALAPQAISFYVGNAFCERELPRTMKTVADTPLSSLLDSDPTHFDNFLDAIEAACAVLQARMARSRDFAALLAAGGGLSIAGPALCESTCGAGVDAEDL